MNNGKANCKGFLRRKIEIRGKYEIVPHFHFFNFKRESHETAVMTKQEFKSISESASFLY